jgi:plastocyanin
MSTTSTAVQPRTVKIQTDANGNMTYTPAVLRARPGDNVVWVCADGDFALSFNERTPFERPGGYFQGHRDAQTPPQVIAATASGSYHYHVAVRRDDGMIWFNSGSPEIFI